MPGQQHGNPYLAGTRSISLWHPPHDVKSMAMVTIAGQRFPNVSPGIFRRKPTIDSAFLPIVSGFSAWIDAAPTQLVLITSGGVVLVKTQETQHLPWDSIAGWDGEALMVGEQRIVVKSNERELPNQFADHLKDNVNDDIPIAQTEPAAESYTQIVGEYGNIALASHHITTLAELPGHRTTRSLGLVMTLQAASGWTAGVRGEGSSGIGKGHPGVGLHCRESGCQCRDRIAFQRVWGEWRTYQRSWRRCSWNTAGWDRSRSDASIHGPRLSRNVLW